MKPHSLLVMVSMIFFAISDLWPAKLIMLYVVISTPAWKPKHSTAQHSRRKHTNVRTQASRHTNSPGGKQKRSTQEGMSDASPSFLLPS